eukprot:2035485-Rhodomonas_salina.1
MVDRGEQSGWCTELSQVDGAPALVAGEASDAGPSAQIPQRHHPCRAQRTMRVEGEGVTEPGDGGGCGGKGEEVSGSGKQRQAEERQREREREREREGSRPSAAAETKRS